MAVHTEPGEAVANGYRVRPLVTVAAADRIRARALATGEQLSGMALGDAVRVAQGGRWLGAEVVSLGMEPEERSDKGEALYAIEVELASPKESGIRRVGRNVTLRLEPGS